MGRSITLVARTEGPDPSLRLFTYLYKKRSQSSRRPRIRAPHPRGPSLWSVSVLPRPFKGRLPDRVFYLPLVISSPPSLRYGQSSLPPILPALHSSLVPRENLCCLLQISRCACSHPIHHVPGLIFFDRYDTTPKSESYLIKLSVGDSVEDPSQGRRR